MYICIHKVSKQRKILINICEDFQDKLELQIFFSTGRDKGVISLKCKKAAVVILCVKISLYQF